MWYSASGSVLPGDEWEVPGSHCAAAVFQSRSDECSNETGIDQKEKMKKILFCLTHHSFGIKLNCEVQQRNPQSPTFSVFPLKKKKNT